MLADLITNGLRQYADRPALIYQDLEITYSDLAAAVDRLAAGFAELGIRPGDRISLLMPNCPEFVFSYYAAASIDAIVVPVNPLLKAGELSYIWSDAQVRLVVADPALLGVVQAARALAPTVQHVVSSGPTSPNSADTGRAAAANDAAAARESGVDDLHFIAELMADGEAAVRHGISPQFDRERESPRHENDCAVIIYTSGTTGKPKGAMLSHRNLQRNIEQVREALRFTADDRFITLLPLFHAFAGTVCMNVAIAAGSASILLQSFVPARAIEAVQRHRATIFPAVPALFAGLLAAGAAASDLAPVRLLVSGGAPLPVSTLEALESRFGIPVIEGDGPTECSPVTCVNPIDGPRKPGSVGLPIPGVQIVIFDENDEPVPTDEIGEICVRGDNVMLGYLNQPEATAAAMRSGWYHTGDLGKLDSDGYIYIVDRKTDMVITSGFNVYPREVEEAILTHPAVLDCAVLGLPDPVRGEVVTAVVVLKPEQEVGSREIQRHCRNRLANYKAPQRVLFRSELPRGATGKVVKRLLKKELELESGAVQNLTQT